MRRALLALLAAGIAVSIAAAPVAAASPKDNDLSQIDHWALVSETGAKGNDPVTALATTASIRCYYAFWIAQAAPVKPRETPGCAYY